ncbi:hypothetical protein BHM03_00040081 [Ensete ventricosum]|nr:hypothetical protein BHM03_00040081 [Ensete ventricosum]
MSPHDKCERELMTTQPWFRAGHGTQDPSNSRHGDLLRIRITQWRRWTFRAPTLIGNVEASAVYLRRAWGGGGLFSLATATPWRVGCWERSDRVTWVGHSGS